MSKTAAMAFIMSKSAYLSDEEDHNGPHLIFFTVLTDGKVWGRTGLASGLLSLLVLVPESPVPGERAAADSCVRGRSCRVGPTERPHYEERDPANTSEVR